MGTPGNILLDSSGRISLDSTGLERIFTTGGCGCCAQGCVQPLTFSGITFSCVYNSSANASFNSACNFLNRVVASNSGTIDTFSAIQYNGAGCATLLGPSLNWKLSSTTTNPGSIWIYSPSSTNTCFAFFADILTDSSGLFVPGTYVNNTSNLPTVPGFIGGPALAIGSGGTVLIGTPYTVPNPPASVTVTFPSAWTQATSANATISIGTNSIPPTTVNLATQFCTSSPALLAIHGNALAGPTAQLFVAGLASEDAGSIQGQYWSVTITGGTPSVGQGTSCYVSPTSDIYGTYTSIDVNAIPQTITVS